MEIPRGEYAIPDRRLVLEVADDMYLAEDRVIYYLCGDNGLGKTTFVEKVLIPALAENEIKYLYLGQDIGLQFYTLRASLAVAGHGLAGLDETALLRLWMHEGRTSRVFLVDEFDKYHPDYGRLLKDNAGFVQTFVVVSHSGQEHLQPLLDDYEICRVPFSLRSVNDETKHVQVSVEPSWR